MEEDGTLKSSESINFETKSFDFIVSNPPYVPTKNILKLEPEIKMYVILEFRLLRFKNRYTFLFFFSTFSLFSNIRSYEDLRALDGGEDGLKIIRPLIQYSAKALKPGGHLFVEVDPAHPEYISFFVKKYDTLKLRHEHTYKDFCNNDRFVEISKMA